MAYNNAAYPNWITKQYPGMEGVNTAMGGFNYLLNDPGFKQLATSAASDPVAKQYQAESGGGAPTGAGAGMFGRLMAGQMGADVAGQAAQDASQNSAQKGKIGAGQSAANIMAGKQSADLQLQSAQAKQAMDQFMAFATILGGKDATTLLNPLMPSSSPSTTPNFSGSTPTGNVPPPETAADQAAASAYGGTSAPSTTTDPGMTSWSPGMWSQIQNMFGFGA